MRKRLAALLAGIALSVGVLWAEAKNGKSDKAGMDCSACCCSKSCPK